MLPCESSVGYFRNALELFCAIVVDLGLHWAILGSIENAWAHTGYLSIRSVLALAITPISSAF
jgi:hypothetical protein